MRDRYIQDTRIHCCLYFINPTGHALRPIDVIVMKKLSEVVNVVPVIAKSDSLTLEERERFKSKVSRFSVAFNIFISQFFFQIREEMIYNAIRLYPFDTDEDEEEEINLNGAIRVCIYFKCIISSAKLLYCKQQIIPFAVVGSENNVIIDGKSVRGRKNRWGVVNVENPEHCEFVHLRNFLTRYNFY